MDIPWDDLQVFLAVAEERSMSAAAKRIRMGQPTVSRRVAALEHRLGYALFRRSVEGVHLTSAGERLLAPARRMAFGIGEPALPNLTIQGLALLDAAIASFRQRVEAMLTTVGENAGVMRSTAASLLAAAAKNSERAEGAVQASKQASVNVESAASACSSWLWARLRG